MNDVRAAVMTGPGELEVRAFPVPEPEPGAVLMRVRLSGICGTDKHTFRGETPRNRSLFLRRGHAYVHFAYGSCWLLNITSERPGVGGGVLLRALEPLEGVGFMQLGNRKAARICDLARGPGRLAAALRIHKHYDGTDLCAKGPLWLGTAPWPPKGVGESARIGITRAVDRRFRFYERGNPCVSGPARLRT